VGNYIGIISELAEKEIFLRNDYEDMVIRSTPGPEGKYFGRFSGEKEYEPDPVLGNIVHDTLGMADEINKEEYENF
jgi:hypothetical protein